MCGKGTFSQIRSQIVIGFSVLVVMAKQHDQDKQRSAADIRTHEDVAIM